jgi:HEAT repeat protein
MTHCERRLALFGWLHLFAASACGVETRSAMELDPAFGPAPVVHTIPPRLIPLWLDALQREDVEAEVVWEIARGIVRIDRLDISVPTEAIDKLASQLQRQDLDRATKLAVARALVDLDAKQYAPLLGSQLADGGRDMASVVEPALARWRELALRDQWLERLNAPHVSERSLQLAIEGIGEIQEPSAEPLLEKIAADGRRHPTIRIAAAKALSQIAGSSLKAFAEDLLASDHADDRRSRLVVALALARQRSGGSLDLLVQLSADEEPAVAAIAIEAILEADAANLLKDKRRLFASADPKIRLLSIRALQQDIPGDAVELLAGLLDDDHSAVRDAAVDALVSLAGSADWQIKVGQRLIDLIDAHSPRATTSALLVLGAIDFEPAAQPVLKLLDAEEPHVAIAAARALERLAVNSTADAILAHAVRENDHTIEIVKQLAPLYGKLSRSEVDPPDLSSTYLQLEELILALGQLRHGPADDFLLRFVPKPVWPGPGEPPSLAAFEQPRPRAAAIWALGKIHADAGQQAPTALVAMLSERLSDVTPIPREEPIVRRMAAVSLGRIDHRTSLPTLREFSDSANPDDEIGRACQWSIERLTGQARASPRSRTVHHIDWFLAPLDP